MGKVRGYHSQPARCNVTKKGKNGVLGASPSIEGTQEAPAVNVNGKSKDVSHLAEYQWKPGESGNPSGRPKIELKETVRAFADEPDPKTAKTRLRQWLEMADRRARQGSPKHLEMLLAYGWGRPNQSLEVDTGVNYTEALTKMRMTHEDANHIIRQYMADPRIQMNLGLAPIMSDAKPTNGHSTPQEAQAAAIMPEQDLTPAREDDAEQVEQGRPANTPTPAMRVRIEL